MIACFAQVGKWVYVLPENYRTCFYKHGAIKQKKGPELTRIFSRVCFYKRGAIEQIWGVQNKPHIFKPLPLPLLMIISTTLKAKIRDIFLFAMAGKSSTFTKQKREIL